ncbi:hypothetical protein ACLOCF_05640 [Levilactobacillus brevis]|uniref:hypothetical protein n=1 Tax=Levilactobacillus brevis TaxID=1580 RepID=UPI003EB8B9C1
MADNKTTLDKLKKYPLASDLDDDEYLQQLINDSWATVQDDHIKPVKQEEANRLLVLSELYVDTLVANGGVQSASHLGESQTMFDWSKGNDPYMLRYQALVDQFGRSYRRGRAFSRD